ncbi:MAG: hypothetical protein ABI041_06870, partial [Bdellovibrionia bacterium]
MKQLLGHHFFNSSRLTALMMIISIITSFHSLGAVASEFETINEETPFSYYQGFQPFSQADNLESDLLSVTS